MILPIITPRQCGDCQMCCHLLDVPAIDKPAHKPCRFQGLAGCEAQDCKPRVCRDFNCAWLDLSLPVDVAERPCDVGVILEVQGCVVVAWEAWEDSIYTEKASWLVNRLAVNHLVVVRRWRTGESLVV